MNNIVRILSILGQIKLSDDERVSRLYLLSQKSMVGLAGFVLFVTYYLYDTLQQSILLWAAVMLSIAAFRFFLSYRFKKTPERFSQHKWYMLFLISNMMTAFLITLLGSFFIYQVNGSEQLFIIAALLGLSAGAMSSLYPDVRIALGYITLLILPLVISLFIIGNDLHLVLACMLTLYYLTQVVIIYNTHVQNTILETKQREIINAQTQLLKNKEALEYFYTQAPIGIFSYDLELRITECNEAFLKLFHLTRDEIIGMDLNILPDKSPIGVIKAALTDGVQHYVGPYYSTKGLDYWVEAKTFPIHDEHQRVIGGIVLIENKTKEHEAIERLRYLASHDTLTQLENRRGFKDYMENLVENSRHTQEYSLLFYLDLNRFKNINDSLGHTFGDRLLQAVAKRLSHVAEGDHNLTRLGGDEFVIVIPFVGQERKKAKEKAGYYSRKIHQIFENPFIIDNIRLYIKTSIGIVVIEPGFNNVEEIVRHADISMYQAKKHGNDRISFYNDSLDQERKKTFSLQQDLIYALEHDLFELYLQPILNIGDDTVRAAEALIRWHHPEKGLMQPDEFIPLAIELGIITDIGWWVLKHACQTISTWKQDGIWNLEYISININAKQLIKNDFIERFFSYLETYNIDTSDIKIEITETSLINNFELTQQVIHELQGRGIKCVIDDFGTGYSSLSYLKKLSFSVLKIDREFIFDLENNTDNETLIRTIVEIAKQFRYSVVVEGIETAEQKEIIRSIDNSLSYQGFLTSKPIPLTDFRKRFIDGEKKKEEK